MKTEARKRAILRWILCLLAMAVVGGTVRRHEARAEAGSTRTFGFNYEFTLKDVPALTKLARIWIPTPVSDANQTVEVTAVLCPTTRRRTHEAEYGNELGYTEVYDPSSRISHFLIVYHFTRKEVSSRAAAPASAASNPPALERFLKPDQLVPTTGKFKELSDQITQGKSSVLDKARAIYDYVFSTMKYDKTGEGWGRGDSVWACNSKRGNCTDFHSVFISLARAAGIPARFEIGFLIPAEQNGEIPGYHCWAEFYAEGTGWIPVDISEAWKTPAKKDYYFGNLDANRVQFSVGRDLTLEPKQDGPALNYFIYPYVEIDGKPFEGKIERKFTFRNLAATPK